MTLDIRISRYLDTMPPAMSGSGGDNQTYTVACRLVWGFALDEEDALRHFLVYNARCVPPWKERDLRRKLQEAAKDKHDNPRGYLLGSTKPFSPKASQKASTPVPVRLKAKAGRFGTLGTTFSNPYAHTGEKTKIVPPNIEGVSAKSSQASQIDPAPDEPLSADEFRATTVPGCHLSRPEEIVCSDDTWRTLNAHPFAHEALIHQALALFGPDATILPTEEAA